MKKISSLILLSAALTCSGNALAEWQEIGKTDLFTVFVDPATLQKQGNLTQIMSMLDFKKSGQNPKTKEKKVISSRVVVTFKPSKILKNKINKITK
jgi:hypothetical protein